MVEMQGRFEPSRDQWNYKYVRFCARISSYRPVWPNHFWNFLDWTQMMLSNDYHPGWKIIPPVASAFPTVGCRIKIFARINFFIQSNKFITGSLNFQKVQYQKEGMYSKSSGQVKEDFMSESRTQCQHPEFTFYCFFPSTVPCSGNFYNQVYSRPPQRTDVFRAFFFRPYRPSLTTKIFPL